MTAEEILFTNKKGQRAQLEDVIDDGLEEDYSERHAALIDLLQHGQPKHRLLACVMLASWGVKEGLDAIIQWADHPEFVPFREVSFDRITGTDDAFAMLADAIMAGRLLDNLSPDICVRREQATRALLGRYDTEFFDRKLAEALLTDPDLSSKCTGEIERAVVAAIERSGHQGQSFDPAFQAAALLGPLARFSDEKAAQQAEALLHKAHGETRVLRELAFSLGYGKGPQSRAVLERLAQADTPSVREQAQRALASRTNG
jgi:hypothetical protein